jgi:hypothetical protein
MSDMTPAEWALCRLDAPPDLRVLQNPYGAWDVLLRVDGGYSDPVDALAAAETHREEIESMVREIRGEPDAA